MKLEVYEQAPNIYTYLRSPRGSGNECNMMAFPMHSKASVLTALTFMDIWQKQHV